jgi:F-type H+-transporting ATPase subunit gamma
VGQRGTRLVTGAGRLTMTRRREIEEHLRSLKDIGEIMNSMKSLSLMETRKLARFLSSQQQALRSIELAAADFLASYPQLSTPPSAAADVYLLIGSEQGFCGDFNQVLIDTFDDLVKSHSTSEIKFIAVGMKLYNTVQDHPLLIESLEGPTVGQEVDAVLTEVVNSISRLGETLGPLSITALHHEHGSEHVQLTSILPPFQSLHIGKNRFGYPPRLNLSSESFYDKLMDHYIFAALFEMFYTSLMAEHYRRMQHLEGAIDRLEQQTDELAKKRNILRQEEITEEIEVIMLSAGLLDKRTFR